MRAEETLEYGRMLFTEYACFVRDIDQSVGKSADKRRDIAIYGLAAEIGSLLSAIKKAILASQADEAPVTARKRQEVTEEIGDVLWYTVLLGQLNNNNADFNVFTNDICNLHHEISAGNQRAATIRMTLTAETTKLFLHEADGFRMKRDFVLDEYQKLAFMTARTEGDQLERVCLAVLTQLGAEVLRTTLPKIEIDLNKNLVDRDLNTVLGEIVWHLSALATLSDLKLTEIADANRAKVTRRYGPRQHTPLHDDSSHSGEQFPRKFDVSFVSVEKGRSRMYYKGRPLGNELTDLMTPLIFDSCITMPKQARLSWTPLFVSGWVT